MNAWLPPRAKRHNLETGQVTLWFPPYSVCPNGAYRIHGGVCWPTETQEGITGHVCVMARHEDTGVMYLVAERNFLTIDHVVDDSGRVELYGIADTFNEYWSQWACHRYWYFQSQVINHRYMVEVTRHPMVRPTPIFSVAPLGEARRTAGGLSDQAIHLVLAREASGQLRYPRDGAFHRALETRLAEPREKYPALHAATCACLGLDRYARHREPEAVLA